MALIIDVMGKEVTIALDENRLRPAESEVFRLCASAEKAKRLTGWSPEFAGLDGLRRGLELTVDWFTNANNLSMYKTGLYNV